MRKLTTHEAILKALNTRWMIEAELVKFVREHTGRTISGSACTARCRDLRKKEYGGHPVTCRFLDTNKGRRRYEYGIAE